MNILALDLSLTDTGFVDADGMVGHVEWAPVPKHKGKMTPAMIRELQEARLAGAELWLCASIRQGIDAIVIEGYSFGSRDGKAFDRAEIRGVLRLAAKHSEIPFVEVPPTIIKLFALGKGSGPGTSKPDMLAAAIRRLDYYGSNENEVDALWLWHLTNMYLQPDSPDAPFGPSLPQTHLAALTGKIHDIDWQGLK